MSDIIRDDKGRFVPGHPTLVRSPGRPRLDDAERIRAAVRGMIDDETIEAWQKAMRKKLAKGNSFAAEYVRDTLVGKPAVTANVNVSGELSAFMAAWQQARSAQPAPDETPDEDEPPTQDDAD